MPVELLSDVSGAGLWVDAHRVLQELQNAHVLLALACVLVFALLAFALNRKRHSARAGDPSSEAVPLTSTGPIHVGTQAKLSIDGDTSRKPILGVIEQIDQRQITIAVPIVESPRVKAGMSMEAFMGSAASGYRFTAILHERKKASNSLLLCFHRPEWVERVQRRSHFRVAVRCPAAVTRVDPASPSDMVFRGVMSNLSGGGMTVCVPFQPPDGCILRVRAMLTGLGETSYEVRVLRSAPARLAHGGMWAASCEFLWMDENSRERIARACFEFERAAKAKAQ